MTPADEKQALRALLESDGWSLLLQRAREIADGALTDLESSTEINAVLRAQGRRRGVGMIQAWPEERVRELNRITQEEG